MANEKLDKPNIIQIALILVKLHLTSSVFDSTEINNCCGESNISSVCFQISSQLFVIRAEWLQCQLITGPFVVAKSTCCCVLVNHWAIYIYCLLTHSIFCCCCSLSLSLFIFVSSF